MCYEVFFLNSRNCRISKRRSFIVRYRRTYILNNISSLKIQMSMVLETIAIFDFVCVAPCKVLLLIAFFKFLYINSFTILLIALFLVVALPITAV